MFRFSDNSREAKRWRAEQMVANSAIEGVVIDPAFIELIEQWEDEGLTQDEKAARITEMARAKP